MTSLLPATQALPTRIPLTRAQDALRYAQELDPADPRLLVAEYVEIDGELDVAAMTEAVRRTLAEAEALTAVVDGDALVLRPGSVPVEVPDLAGADPEAWMAADLARPVDLACGPLTRTALLEIGDGRWWWYLRTHHLALDAHGFALVRRRAAEHCTELTGGRPAGKPLNPLSRTPEAPVVAADRAYWLDRFADRPDVPDLAELLGPDLLGPDLMGPELPGPTAALHRVRLPAVRCSDAETVPVEAAVAAVAAFVHRATGAPTVVLGVPSLFRPDAGARRRPDTATSVLPLRVELAPELTVGETVARTAEAWTQLRVHQGFRGEDLRRELGLGRDRLVGPLVNVKPPAGTLRFGDLAGTTHAPAIGRVDDVAVLLVPGPGGTVDVELQVDGHRWSRAAAERLAERLGSFLDRFPADPGRRIGTLDVRTDTERARTGTAGPGMPAAVLPDLFAAQVAATPDAPAVTDGPAHDGRVTWTYAELADRSARIARVLIADGVGPGDVVAVALPRSADLLATILGMLAAGVTYLPLDPEHPTERLASTIADSGARFVLTDAAGARRLAGGDRRADRVDVTSAAFTARTAAADPGPVTDADRARPLLPDDGAHLIYTSGSTGRPKGALVPHRAVAALVTSTRDRMRLGPADTWSWFHSAAFDVSVFEIWGALATGGRIVVVPVATVREPREFHALLAREHVTVLSQTPSAFAQLNGVGGTADPALRMIIFAGEALEPARVAAWRERHPAGPDLVNMYGITETTVHTTWVWTDPAEQRSRIGVPLPGRVIHLLDGALAPVPDGVAGEMYVGGDGLAQGYHGRPGLTASRFLPDPFGPPGARMYRSGDLARRLPDGELEYLGRSDAQVQLRGFRIEPAQVAAAVLAGSDTEGIADAVVVVREDRPGDQRLVAYVTARPGAAVDPGAVRTRLAGVLPAHELPAAIVPVAAFPTTANGKLDRAALPRPGALPSAVTTISRTGAPQQQVLCELFAEVLGVPTVDPDDDFFALGGHSLVATRLIGRVRDVLDTVLDVRALFAEPTPRQLAERLRPQRPGAPVLRAAADAAPDTGPALLSSEQRRMWFQQRAEGPGPTYNLPWALTLSGPLDVAALRAALHDVVERHDVLRTLVPARDGEPRPVVLPAAAAVALAEPGPWSDDAVRAAAVRGFDLASSAPLRADLFTRGPDEHLLLLCLHHIAGDDRSLAPLVADLVAAYEARRAGTAPSLAPLPVRYGDYARWQRELLAEPHGPVAAGLGYWRAALAGLPDRIELPTDRPRPPLASGAGAQVPVRIDGDLHAALRALALDRGASLFMVLHAALVTLLHRVGAGTDVAVGTPVAGRTEAALDDLVGLFVNTVVLRTDLAGDPSFVQALDRVRDADLAAYAHQDVPFDRLVEELNPPRALDRHPLFQVMLAFTTGAVTAGTGSGLRVTTDTVATGTAKFDLTLNLRERPEGGIAGFLEYATDLFDAPGAAALAERFERVLRAVVAAPDTPVGRVDVLDPAERRELVHGRNATDGPISPLPVTEMIDEQVRRAPDAVAVVFEGISLTYGELDARANRLARHLAELGVGPERTVGVHVPRSADMIVGLLAVLKCGGAFVPMDRGWPPIRTADVVDAARMTAILGDDRSAAELAGIEGPGGDVPVVDVTDPALTTGPPVPAPAVRNPPEGLAYVIYTSGSTGMPKGAMIRHVAVSNRLPWQIGLLGLTPDDAVLFKAPLTFDISVNEILLPLAAGARLVVAAPGGDKDVSYLLDLIAAQRVTFVYLVSTMLDLMLQRPGVRTAAASLAHVWCGGEVLTPELYQRFAATMEATMYHGYGPAEATIGVSCSVYRGEDDIRNITIGRPNPNSRVYVLDRALQPAPVGVPGELYIGGTPLARGYLHDPVRTATRFVADPLSGEAGGRLYATGDLARMRTDGDVEFLGRVDNQVKIRGMRVELEEIEAVLAQHPAVRQAVVLLDDGAASLSAHCTVTGPVAEPDLLAWLGARLPAHMVPARVTVLDAFPLMPSGKIDRSALAATAPPEPLRHTGAGTPPNTPTELLVAGIWAEVLGVGASAVGADDGFFDLGGHSLLLARVQARLQRELGRSVSVLDLFTHSTVRGLGAHLDSESTGSGRAALGMILPLRTEGTAPPLFCFHPASGLSWPFAGLRRHVGDDTPIYGVQARGLDEPRAVPASLDEMAREYTAAIREVAPAGPYRLLGWSFGGVAAHTVATLLQADGEEVELLAMLDSYPAYPWDRLAEDHEQQALRSLLYMAHYDLEQIDAQLATGGGPLDRDRVAALVAEQGGVLAALPDTAIRQVMDTFVNSAPIQQGAGHRVFRGAVDFFTATVDPIDTTLSHEDWAPYVDGTIRNLDVACAHRDMAQTGPLALIGRVVDRALRRASAG